MAWALTAFWSSVAVFGALGFFARDLDWAGSLTLLSSLALAARTLRVGLYVDSRRSLRCVHWFYTKTYRSDEGGKIRVVAYSGFANRFSDSGILGMLAVEFASGKVVPVRPTIAPGRSLLRAPVMWETGQPEA